jgi:pyridoxamine 5'-phosphate oxidase
MNIEVISIQDIIRFNQKIRSRMINNIFKEFGTDPLLIFQKWFAEAQQKELNDPNAMALATMDTAGKPSVRIVLLKGYDGEGFIFFTNYESRKGEGLLKHPYAELNFYWKSTEKQIRICGEAVKTTDAESDAYFASRPRESQIGAWASMQTRPLDDYADFEKKMKEIDEKFAGKDIPRPPHWGGFRVKPERMEFWIAHPHRLHKRFVFEKENNEWKATWLFP